MTVVVCMVALPIKAYAFVTMNKQGWLTRHATRLVATGRTPAALLRRRLPRENPLRRRPADRRVLRLALDGLGGTDNPPLAQPHHGQEYTERGSARPATRQPSPLGSTPRTPGSTTCAA